MGGKRINCWEFMKCGKDNTDECPAYPKAGRICYLVAGTMCEGSVQGMYALKIHNCRECDFYKTIVVERATRRSGSD